MSKEKLIIEKLAKIVTNQQKIITKLAQQVNAQNAPAESWIDISHSVQNILNRLPNGKDAHLVSAKIGGEGNVEIRLNVHDLNSEVGQYLHRALAGNYIEADNGKSYHAGFDSVNIVSEKG